MTNHRRLDRHRLDRHCHRGLGVGDLEPTSTLVSAAGLADLVCADQDLLTAEFDAIIAANFPDEPSDQQQGTDGPDPWQPPPALAVGTADRLPPARADPSPGRVRRSPGRARSRDLRPRQRDPPLRRASRATGTCPAVAAQEVTLFDR